jgi:hypothetical protein
MPGSVTICPECGGENRYGAGRCIHCATLLDGKPEWMPRTNIKELNQELEDMRISNERARLARANETEEERRIRIEAESLDVLPHEEFYDNVVLIEPVSFPWLRYVLYAAAAAVIIGLGYFAYKLIFPPPLQFATVSNYTERSGSPMFKHVLAVVSKSDYARAQESIMENSELFDTMVNGSTAKLIPNGTNVEVIEYSVPYSLIKLQGQFWYVLSDYVNMVDGKAQNELDYDGGDESFSEF